MTLTRSLCRLKEEVMKERKEICESPWPPSDNKVGVVIVAHSMGYVPAFP